MAQEAEARRGTRSRLIKKPYRISEGPPHWRTFFLPIMLQCMSPLLALSGQSNRTRVCPLLE